MKNIRLSFRRNCVSAIALIAAAALAAQTTETTTTSITTNPDGTTTTTTTTTVTTAAPSGVSDSSKPKFKINPTGRILMDGAIFTTPQSDMFKPGFAIPDARLGVKMSYGKWNAKIDVGFAYGKVGLKDLYIGYDFNSHHNLKIGSFIHQYGLQSATSSSMKPTMEEPISNAVFNDSRQLGIQYEYSGPKFLATASAHVEPSATSVVLRPQQFNKEGFGFRTRLVARPICEDGKVVQVGFSAGFSTPQKNSVIDQDGEEVDLHNAFQFKSNFPTRVTQITAIDATVTDARNQFKFTPELLLNYQRVALESQYYFNRVSRRNGLHNWTGQGAYVTLRGLLLGKTYTYDYVSGGLATPAPKSLECVVDYNYTKLSDAAAGIYGGRLNDLSVTFNYYINKYMIARLHYSYTHTWDRSGVGSMSLNGFMARLQIIF